MNKEIKKKGRPKKEDALTGAAKQANYRARCKASEIEKQKALDFKKAFEYKINEIVKEYEENCKKQKDRWDQQLSMGGILALSLFKWKMELESSWIDKQYED